MASILPGSGYAAADHSNPNLRSWHGTSVRGYNVIQMSNATRRIAEFGNHKANGGVRIVVEVGDGLSPTGYAHTVDSTASRGDGKDYTISGCTHQPCSVSLPANRHSVPITINVNDDGIDEDDETIVITLKDGGPDPQQRHGLHARRHKGSHADHRG